MLKRDTQVWCSCNDMYFMACLWKQTWQFVLRDQLLALGLE
jgi:hypothetical protein